MTEADEGEGSFGRSGDVIAWTSTLLAVGAFLFEARQLRSQLDDSFISYRYARNLVEGSGLVYNPGEYVEGFTNLLWTLLVALGLELGFDAQFVGHALGVASGVALLAGATALGLSLVERSAAAFVALVPWTLVATPALLFWATSGMETVGFCAAALGAFAAQYRGRSTLAFGLALVATLTRPEGGLVAIALLVNALFDRRSMRALPWRGIAVYGFGCVAVTVFRIAYYGSPVPNTFYAKVGGVPVERGFEYAWRYAATGVGAMLPAALFAAVRLRAVALASWMGMTLVWVIAIGGDNFFLQRFLLPLSAPIAALACAAAATVGSAGRGAWRVAILASVAASMFILVEVPPKRRAYLVQLNRFNIAHQENHRAMAERVRRQAPEARSVALAGIGVFGWVSRLHIVDYLGLIDATVARSRGSSGSNAPAGHQRSNAAHVLARRPDLIFLGRPDADPAGAIPAVRDILAHPEFDAHYRYDPMLGGWRRTR